MIIVAHGGSGSSHLIRQGRKIWGKDFGERPDADLKPPWWCEGLECPVKDFNQKADKGWADKVQERTGERVDREATIEANLTRIIKSRKHWMLSWSSIFGFLSKAQPDDEIVFVVRHPLHQAVSYLHPGTGEHGRDAFAHGMDITSPHGMAVFARFWNLHVREYFKCAALGMKVKLWRFEFPFEYHEVFEGWDGSSRHGGEVPMDAERTLKDLTDWGKVYDTWNLRTP